MVYFITPSGPDRNIRIRHSSVGTWTPVATCTCAGDSFLFIDATATTEAVELVTNTNQAPASCQIPGAISNGKIEAGHLAVAVVAQTWILHSLRELSGESGFMKPKPRADSVILGTLGRVSEEREVAE